jgi:hypothetical protein
MTNEALDQDQEDYAARLAADPYFADVTVLVQRKGVTESDIDTSLSVLNEKGGKIGACVIVIMPALAPDAPNAPGPSYNVQPSVQVIEQPLFNQGEGGTGKSAEAIAQRVRQLLHMFDAGGRSALTFAGMDPVPGMEAGKISYAVKFSRVARDPSLPKVATPEITALSSNSLTLACATVGAALWYSTNGSLPVPGAEGSTLWTGDPITFSVPCLFRVVGYATGRAASNVAAAEISAP